QPPWTPPVLWDHVTLTCHGLGTAAATTWYKDGQRWRLQGPDRFRVTQSGTYQCHRPDTGTELSLSPLQLHHSGRYRCSGSRSPRPISFPELFPVPVLEGPPEPTEGSPLNLSCLSTPSPLRPRAPLLHLFYRHGRLVGGPQGSPQLLLPAVGVSHSGNYSCQVRSERGPCGRAAPGSASRCAPPGAQVALGDRLVLNCTVATGTGPLSFSWHRGDSWALLGTGPHLELRHVGDNDSGHYQCRASDGHSPSPVYVPTVPVANATISPGALAQPVRAGDPVTLRCSVQVGSAPVTFTWLRNGSEVARGPLLELGDVHVGHSGTYQCVATNQLGQDGHRVFQALSPELALTVTLRGHWDTGGLTRGHWRVQKPRHGS
uniref:Uncharacterized protein n=1 Tax=Corvus moneduloides TaxID=1196302 RepID=A0A8U7NVU7_CORMO